MFMINRMNWCSEGFSEGTSFFKWTKLFRRFNLSRWLFHSEIKNIYCAKLLIFESFILQASTNNTPVNPFLTSTQQVKQVQQNQVLLDLQKNSNNQSTHQPLITLPKLTEDDIAKFKAEKFIFGQIPTCPPPPELCR